MKETIKVEIIAMEKEDDAHQKLLDVIIKMHNRKDDMKLGLVESINLYTRQIKKAPLYGNDDAVKKGMIFQSFQN